MEDLNFLPDGMTLIADGGQVADIGRNVESASVTRTTDGASTLSLRIFDPERTLLKSGMLSKRITAQVDDHSFELAGVDKDGDSLTLTMEDLLVAEMRRHNEPRKFAAGSVTRVEAARELMSEIPWAVVAVSNNNTERVKTELARGTLTAVATETSSSEPASGIVEDYFSGGASRIPATSREKASEITDDNREDTWTAIKRWFAEINWRCYVDKGTLNLGPDSAYVNGPAVYDVREFSAGIGFVNFDWDVGKPMSEGTYDLITSRWDSPAGTTVELFDLGPADGKWFVSQIERDLFAEQSSVTIKFPEPELPEPDPPPEPAAGAAEAGLDANYFANLAGGGAGTTVTGGAGAPTSNFWAWPIGGDHRINSGFGARSSPTKGASSQHQGIDINASLNQAVTASHDGVVTFAGQQSGYGNVVYIKHNGTKAAGPLVYETRYGHLNRIRCRNGMAVKKGDIIGGAGQTGTATGVHLHFEIRKLGSPVNPLPLLLLGSE
ncbi:peptidoglycan DD-metalloendopeptidase family protein [Kineococcus sp. T13]|uniref:M23 family metallopeptidase n=1 Tax=Kineococcus vitellinus TaxID=2696565 RepID=UPI0014127EAE|nr:M23 family metallopeptidase [Kineococcus vitellinus]NAZ73848.1 peptidoglycan DD-metalloendopeptidase family protein [Kineococcus vitellinus]